MVYLLFQIGNDSYALDGRHIVEVLPMVDLKGIPRAPVGLAGVFNYHGTPVPVLDLAGIILGRSSAARMNTRLVVIEHHDSSGHKSLLGLLAERTTDMLRREEADFVPSGLATGQSPHLGPVTVESGRLVQRIEIEHLVPPDIGDQFFSGAIKAG